jgi:hypothetical protein
MNRATTRRVGAGRGPWSVGSVLITALLLVACTGGPTDGNPDDATPSSSASTAAPEATVEPLREARAGWKVFTDPARLVSFELPEEWVVQPLQVGSGAYAPDSLHYAVRTQEGTTTAEFHSGIITQEPPCAEGDRTPYYVIGSEPLELTGAGAATTGIEPRFVVRLITGFRFFGAYGVADQVGGEDGLACSLPNTVQGGEALGLFSFGDIEVLAPKAPADTGPGTVSFGTLGEAEAHYDTPEFETVRTMILSLRIAPTPAG